MAVEIVVPVLGESVTEATIARWIKRSGDAVKADEPIVELETDKVTVEVPAPASGVLGELKVAEGDNVEVGALLASIDESGTPAPAKAAPKAEVPKAEAAKAPAPAAVALATRWRGRTRSRARPCHRSSATQPSATAPRDCRRDKISNFVYRITAPLGSMGARC